MRATFIFSTPFSTPTSVGHTGLRQGYFREPDSGETCPRLESVLATCTFTRDFFRSRFLLIIRLLFSPGRAVLRFDIFLLSHLPYNITCQRYVNFGWRIRVIRSLVGPLYPGSIIFDLCIVDIRMTKHHPLENPIEPSERGLPADHINAISKNRLPDLI